MTTTLCILQALVLLSTIHFAASFAFLGPQNAAAPPKNCRLLILPGFGNASGDYTMDGSLVSSLLKRGWEESQIDVLPLERQEWLGVFLRGLLDVEFWKGTASPTRPAFRWYLKKVAQQLQELGEEESVILVGHSAGGWLARAAVGYGSTSNADEDEELSIDLNKVMGIVTLGAPNLPPPSTVMDMTRGALRITNEEFPGAFHAPTVRYMTVVGNAVQGRKQDRSSPFEQTTVDGFAFESYEAVCGDGTTVGDGVVPVCSAHVDGATQITLQNVYHSINRPDQWYGAEDVLDEWHDTMLNQLKTKENAFDPMKLFAR